jgi:hypothetical protein
MQNDTKRGFVEPTLIEEASLAEVTLVPSGQPTDDTST